MAKQWFYYALSTTSCAAQNTPGNYVAVGAFPIPNPCVLANRTCLIYTYTSSGNDQLPSPSPGGAPAISSKLQAYITLVCSGGGPVVAQPATGKKYLYVQGG